MKDDKEVITDEEEKPATHLGKHLVIAYFHDWLEDNGDLLNSFYSKASVRLRKATNHFFTTGFPEKTDPEPFDSEQTKRIIQHWKNRLSDFEANKNSSAVTEEAIGLVQWIKSCPIEPKTALKLLSKTLGYTGGIIGKDDAHYIPEFIIGSICKIGKGHEPLALECLLKFSKDPRLGGYSRTYKNELIPFVQYIASLKKYHPNLHEIREKTCELLDNYGRAGIYSTRTYYSKIRTKTFETLRMINIEKFNPEIKAECNDLYELINVRINLRISNIKWKGSYSLKDKIKKKTIAKYFPHNFAGDGLYVAISTTNIEAEQLAKLINNKTYIKTIIRQPFMICKVPDRSDLNEIADILLKSLEN